MKKFLLAVPAVLLLALAACGGQGGQDQAVNQPVAPPQAEMVAVKDERGHVVYERSRVIQAEPVRTRDGRATRDQVIRIPGLPDQGGTGW